MKKIYSTPIIEIVSLQSRMMQDFVLAGSGSHGQTGEGGSGAPARNKADVF